MLQPFNTVPHVAATPTIKLSQCHFDNCNFATVMYNVNICYSGCRIYSLQRRHNPHIEKHGSSSDPPPCPCLRILLHFSSLMKAPAHVKHTKWICVLCSHFLSVVMGPQPWAYITDKGKIFLYPCMTKKLSGAAFFHLLQKCLLKHFSSHSWIPRSSRPLLPSSCS